MAKKILIKRSAVAGKVPTTSDLDLGELGINTTDGKIFLNNSGSSIEQVLVTNTRTPITGTLDLTGGAGTISASVFSGSYEGYGGNLTGIVASAAPAGPNTAIQFRDGADTSGSADFTFNKTTPAVTLSGSLLVTGSFRYVDNNQQTGYVLTSDTNGVATWQAAAGGGGGIFTEIGTTDVFFTTSSIQITGSLTVSSSVIDFTGATAISGSTFSGSFVGDGSGLTGITTRVAGSVQTSTATPTIVDTIDTLTNNDIHFVEVYVSGKDTGGNFTDWGSAKRSYVITVSSSIATIEHENADLDKWSATLGATSVSASVNGANVDIYVIGTANTIDWVSAYEIVVNS